jgi:AraC-like DNA-binding protein
MRSACAAGTVHADLAHNPGSREPSYGFLLLLSGSGHVTHYGHESVLGEGDFILLNGSAPHSFAVDEDGAFVMLRVPLKMLRTYLPAPEHFCGRALRASDGVCESAADFTLGICDQLEEGLPLEFRSRIARNLLNMLATAFSIVLDRSMDGSPVICRRNARVRLHIEEHLRDPELKPSTIAASLRLSPRYLRLIFAASKETVSAYILRRRLEECARMLADPQLHHQSITEIAFGWGFNSGPHFARSFRDRFGIPPRDYRRTAVGQDQAAVNQ